MDSFEKPDLQTLNCSLFESAGFRVLSDPTLEYKDKEKTSEKRRATVKVKEKKGFLSTSSPLGLRNHCECCDKNK